MSEIIETTETTDQSTEKVELTPKLLPIKFWPDPALNKICTPVVNFDPDFVQFTLDLFYTLTAYKNTIGLAAPQVGVFQRVFCLLLEQNKPLICINPEIVEVHSIDMMEWDEGCLSVPNFHETRKRPMTITVKYQDLNQQTYQSDLTGLYSFAFQHELDHLNGITFVDQCSKLKRAIIKRKVDKMLRKIRHSRQ